MQQKVNTKENKREKQEEEKLNEHSVGNLVIKKAGKYFMKI